MGKKKLFVLAAVILVTGVAVEVFLSVKDIGLGPQCQGVACVGLDAKELRCDSRVETLVGEVIRGTTVELRYSPSCNASWTKAIVPIGTVLYVEDAQGRQFGEYEVKNDGILTAHYGNMGAGKALKGCAKLPNSDRLCTSFPRTTN